MLVYFQRCKFRAWMNLLPDCELSHVGTSSRQTTCFFFFLTGQPMLLLYNTRAMGFTCHMSLSSGKMKSYPQWRETSEHDLGRVASEIVFCGFAQHSEDFSRDIRTYSRTENLTWS